MKKKKKMERKSDFLRKHADKELKLAVISKFTITAPLAVTSNGSTRPLYSQIVLKN